MKLVVIIPAYNEENTIAKVIDLIPSKIDGISKIEALVINDGSTDNTDLEAKKANAIVVSHPKNKGVGKAFQMGIDKALDLNADIIVNIDADLQFNPNDIPILIKPILNDEADMVTASRFKDKKLIPIMPLHKKIGNYIFSSLISFLIKQKFYDTQCGFRAYSKEAALHLNLFGEFTYTQEAFIDLAFRGLRIVELPLVIKGEREHGKSKVASNALIYAFRALNIIIRTIRDYKPLMFFGFPGLVMFLIGLLIDLILFIRWLITEAVSPYTTLVLVGIVFLILGFLMIVLALIADMNSRLRKNQERILFEMKSRR